MVLIATNAAFNTSSAANDVSVCYDINSPPTAQILAEIAQVQCVPVLHHRSMPYIYINYDTGGKLSEIIKPNNKKCKLRRFINIGKFPSAINFYYINNKKPIRKYEIAYSMRRLC